MKHYPELKVFGKSEGKFKIILSLKIDGVYHTTHLVRLCSRDEVADFLKTYRRAYSEVKKMRSSKALTIFKQYSLRWVAARTHEIYIVDDDDNAKNFSRRSAVVQWVLDSLF